MQRMQRKMGRLPFMTRAPNEADIEAMLRDFNDSNQMLERIESAAKQWRDAWTNILNHQLTLIEHMQSIYKPLGASGGEYSSHVHADTPPETMERCVRLQEAFAELKTDMMEEVKDIEKKLILPAKLARDALGPMKKAIKKREDKKIDYERYKSRAEALQKKKTRSDRENTALNKHEADLARAVHEYEYADEGLRTQLPRLNAATFSLLPHLLANQIILQNNLIGNLYTVLHQYSHEQGYPDPPPEPEEVIPMWEASFTSMRLELEGGLDLLRGGKAIHQPMRLPDKGETMTGLGIRNKVMPRKTSAEPAPTLGSRTTSRYDQSPRPDRYNSQNTLSPPVDNGPPVNLGSKPSFNSLTNRGTSPGLTPTNGDEWGRRASSSSYNSNATNGRDHSDYFGSKATRQNSANSYTSGAVSPNMIAAKKKPPPPPPPKKIGSFHGEYVIAMYDFDAHSEGDLSFREGDRIKVTKKTPSSQDWWEGELNGQRGSFPANYVK